MLVVTTPPTRRAARWVWALLAAMALTCVPVLALDDSLPDFNAPRDDSPLSIAKINRFLGVPIFQEPSLWSEDDIFAAKRLGWPNESRTYSQSSFSLYPNEKNPVTVLGARAYSCVLYASRGRPTEVSIVFANLGDYGWARARWQAALRYLHRDDPAGTPDGGAPTTPEPSDSRGNVPNDSGTNSASSMAAAKAEAEATALRQLSEDDLARIDHQVELDFEATLKHDTQAITESMTQLFGDPVQDSFGGGAQTREHVARWDWQGHSFLLATPRGKYVTLRIVPTAVADAGGKEPDIDRDELRTRLQQEVKRQDNGDVVVTNIPMVDQGPKGYCVPATWERYLRYLGIPADMYVLALAAGTTPDGGTDLSSMVANVDSLVTLYHRRISGLPGDLDMTTVSKRIDSGLPIMWTCFIHVPFERAISRSTIERRSVTDFDAWAVTLETKDKDLIPQDITGSPSVGGHQRMIIGYNDKTNEIAISDSWSQAFAIRWMTLAEANAINAGLSYVIEP